MREDNNSSNAKETSAATSNSNIGSQRVERAVEQTSSSQSAQSSNSNVKSNNRSAVYLRVYDISGGAAKLWSPIVLGRKVDGVWHSGVEVFGYEYFYGGGIVKMLPDNVEDTFGISPTRIHHLGYTSMLRNQFEKHLIAIMPMFSREVYDLVNWNCNHFSEHATRHLVDRGIPSYILDLPHEICKTFMGKIVLNFFKMLQGGSAPVTVDDPQHPSRVLSKTKVRRNSCPPTPSAGSNRENNRYQDEFGVGSSSSSSGGFGNIVNGSAKSTTGVRSTQRRRTHTASVANNAAAAAATAAASKLSGSSTMKTGHGVTFRNTLPADEKDEDGVGGGMKTIMGGRLQDRKDTQLVFSPRHKRLYEMERDKYGGHAHYNNNRSHNSHQQHSSSQNGSRGSNGSREGVEINTVRRVSHGGRNVPASTRRTTVGQRSYSVGRHATAAAASVMR